MSGNCKNITQQGKRYSGEIIDIKNEDEELLEEFLEKNGRGIVFIDLVKTANFHVNSLSDGARKIIQGTNAGGNSQISEAISYEIFYVYRCAELVMVSRLWLFVYCNVLSEVINVLME